VTGFVAGQSAAKYANSHNQLEVDYSDIKRLIERVFEPCQRKVNIDPAEITYAVHQAIVPMKYNRQREAGRIKEALEILKNARNKLHIVGVDNFHNLAKYHSAESMLMAAEFTLKAALMREESRAGHFREDFPSRDDVNWFKWITIQSENSRTVFKTLPVPVE
jgi:succinate dehydrogenase/fumarate reductase flavoprotein subunit